MKRLLVFSLLFLFAPPAFALDSLFYQPGEDLGTDTVIRNNFIKTRNYGIESLNGLLVENWSEIQSRTLIRFDYLMKDLQSISMIDSAVLALYAYNSNIHPLTCLQVLEQWTEGNKSNEDGQVNWIDRTPTAAWTDTGGTFSYIDSVIIQHNGQGKWDYFNVTEIVRNWMTDTTSHYGFLIKQLNEIDGYYAEYRSSGYNANTGLRPKLTVYYSTKLTLDSVTALSGNSLRIKIDTLLSNPAFDSFMVFSSTDFSAFGSAFTALADTIDTLSVNTNYRIMVGGFLGADTIFTNSDSAYTFSSTPSSPLLGVDGSNNILYISLSTDSNPSWTEYAIFDSTRNAWIDMSGAISASAVWHAKSLWDTVTYSNLSSDTTYVIKVRARNGDYVLTAFSSSISIELGPTPPEGLQAISTNVNTLSWNANTEPDLKLYYIYRDDDPGFSTNVLLDSVDESSTSYMDDAVSLGTIYYYAIKAADSSGLMSAFSDIVSGTPQLILSVPPILGAGPAQVFTVPVYFSNDISGLDVYSFRLSVGFDSTKLSYIGYDTAGTLSSLMQISSNTGYPDSVLLGGSNEYTLSAATDTLIILEFQVKTGVSLNDSSPVAITYARLNEGEPGVYIENGIFYVNSLHYGDINRNGDVTPLDASMAMQYDINLISLDAQQLELGDVSDNGSVTSFDASLILQYSLALIDSFPAGSQYNPKNADFNKGLIVSVSPDKQTTGTKMVIPLLMSNVEFLYSGSFALEFSPEEVLSISFVPSEILSGFIFEGNKSGNLYSAAFASATPLSEGGVIGSLIIEFAEESKNAGFRFTRMEFNEIPMEVSALNEKLGARMMPKQYNLSQNYPNPFNPETIIDFELPEMNNVSIEIYTITGQLVRRLVNESKPSGFHSVVWDGTNDAGVKVSSGIYIYRMTAGSFSQIRKMVFLK